VALRELHAGAVEDEALVGAAVAVVVDLVAQLGETRRDRGIRHAAALRRLAAVLDAVVVVIHAGLVAAVAVVVELVTASLARGLGPPGVRAAVARLAVREDRGPAGAAASDGAVDEAVAVLVARRARRRRDRLQVRHHERLLGQVYLAL